MIKHASFFEKHKGIFVFALCAVLVVTASMLLPRSQNSVRSLQESLREPILQLKGVEDALVELTISGGAAENKGIVSVTLSPGAALSAEQSDYILNLIANSVPELTVDQVAVLDSRTGETIADGTRR